MLTSFLHSSHEDGTMLVKLNPLDIHILNTRQRRNDPLSRADEFRSHMRPRLLQVVSRRQLSYFRLFFDTHFRMPMFAQ